MSKIGEHIFWKRLTVIDHQLSTKHFLIIPFCNESISNLVYIYYKLFDIEPWFAGENENVPGESCMRFRLMWNCLKTLLNHFTPLSSRVEPSSVGHFPIRFQRNSNVETFRELIVPDREKQLRDKRIKPSLLLVGCLSHWLSFYCFCYQFFVANIHFCNSCSLSDSHSVTSCDIIK